MTQRTASLPSVLAALAVVLTTYWIALRLFGAERALVAGLTSLTTVGIFSFARVPMPVALVRLFARRARRFLLAEVREELAQIHLTLDEMRASAQPGAVGSARIETDLARSIESAVVTMALDRRSDQTSQNQDGGLPRDVPPCEILVAEAQRHRPAEPPFHPEPSRSNSRAVTRLLA